MSPAVTADEPDPTFDFRLDPAPPFRGRVLLDGRPVEGAEVLMATPSQALIYQTQTGEAEDALGARTDADGRFQFAAGFERYTLVARHPKGYAEGAYEAKVRPGDLTLRPWARVEGRLMQAGRPIATTWVGVEPTRVSVLGRPRIQERYDVETDQEGRFAFAKLPPIPSSVRPQFSVWRDSPLTSGRSLPLDLQPGGRVEVEIGGAGATVVGRVLPQGDGRVELPKALNYLVRRGAGVEPTPEVRAIGFDAGKGWDEAWASTPEGMAYLATRDHALVKLDADGRFRVDGLPAGDYDLALRLFEPPDGGCLVSPVGRRVVSFRIEGDGTVDLGDLAVDTVPAPRVGEPAPDLAFNSFDGRAARLADLRGRYVLVDFWASWCAPCAASLPVLRRIHENHGDGRLAILGLSVDEDADAARRFAETNKGAWMQGAADADVRARYAVGAVPAFFLIGPDGRLVHVGLGVEEVEGVLEKLLK
ncbi:redoxin domain-containing protein [Paludisphaera soli]|uniref:redoxin domain-containing protein n=1 Tax=Paludisphaera soli TaxID=2712865 RepID=UPI0013EAA3F1|nr:redoxin domain-containing protein [Paludisphaera soli]